KQLTATDAATSTNTYASPANGFQGCRLLTTTDPRGHTTAFSYFADGRLLTVIERAVPVGSIASGEHTGARDMQTTLAYGSLTDANAGTRGNLTSVTTLHPGYVAAQNLPRNPADTTQLGDTL